MLGGGNFSNVWWSSLIRIRYCNNKKDAALCCDKTKDNKMALFVYIANAVFQIVKNHGGFRGGRSPHPGSFPVLQRWARIRTEANFDRCQAKFLTSAKFLPWFCFNNFASHNKEVNSGNYFFDVCCVNLKKRCRVPTKRYSTRITLTIENFRTLSLATIIFLFLTLA